MRSENATKLQALYRGHRGRVESKLKIVERMSMLKKKVVRIQHMDRMQQARGKLARLRLDAEYWMKAEQLKPMASVIPELHDKAIQLVATEAKSEIGMIESLACLKVQFKQEVWVLRVAIKRGCWRVALLDYHKRIRKKPLIMRKMELLVRAA